MRKTLVVLSTLAVLAVPSSALAGGWAVASFDEVPRSLEADTTQTLDFIVLAHGRTPADWGPVEIQFTSGTEKHVFNTTNHGNGRYSVEVIVPAGFWAWSVVQQGHVLSSMGTIDVTSSGATAGTNGPIDILRIVLPIAAIIAAGFTFKELANRRRHAAAPTT